MLNIIVLATSNHNKLKEFQILLKNFPVEIKCLKDYRSLPTVIEDGDTFEENAYKKASHYAKILGIPALADDSGLVVDALDGSPGVYSARYAGENSSDWDNCEKLLRQMKGETNRRAQFKCVLSLATPGGPALTWEGSCEGEITTERKGDSGFGYDPVFFYKPLNKTFSELLMEDKNIVSHRGKAMAEFSAEFDNVLTWLKHRLEEEKPPKPDHTLFENKDWSDEM